MRAGSAEEGEIFSLTAFVTRMYNGWHDEADHYEAHAMFVLQDALYPDEILGTILFGITQEFMARRTNQAAQNAGRATSEKGGAV